MNNRNLHSPTKLTEFARNFDTEPDTLLSKFVNKITYVYNSGYNSVNVIPTTSSVLNMTNSVTTSNAAITTSSPRSMSNQSSSSQQSISSTVNTPTTSLVCLQQHEDGDQQSVQKVQKEPFKPIEVPLVSGRINVRTPSNVVQRISNLMAVRNNVYGFSLNF